MANIRIKDLSTTASSTASDDFFGVDGATNGTRKLDAYSPTFGGDLVSGASGSDITRISAANAGNPGIWFGQGTTTTLATAALSGASTYTVLNAPTSGGLYLRIGNDSSKGVTFNGTTAAFGSGVPVTVANTTASTSTSTGALVVSGGVGVAGAANFGGAISIGNTVNVVSPTSPNRTVTIVIGGTTYYLAAKTTND